MSGQSLTRSAERIIVTFASRQHGVVARWQLLEAGVTADQIDWRLHNGRLHEIHRGVYLVGHTAPPPLAVEQAALLACREPGGAESSQRGEPLELGALPSLGSGLGHRSSGAELHSAPHQESPRTAPPTGHPQAPWASPHESARTILDLSLLLDEEELESVVAEAEYRRLASEDELRAQLVRR